MESRERGESEFEVVSLSTRRGSVGRTDARKLGHAQRPPWSLQREGDDGDFPGNPLVSIFPLLSGPFLFLFFCFYLNTALK